MGIFVFMGAAWGTDVYDPGLRLLEEQDSFLQERERLTEAADFDFPVLDNVSEAEIELEASFEVRAIEFVGSGLLSEDQKRVLTHEYLGEGRTLVDIDNLVVAINNFFIKQGCVTTRAYLDSCDVKLGIVMVRVQEGVVEHIDSDSKGTFLALPGIAGSLLRVRDLEQGLDNVNRLKSRSAVIALWPGERVGGSVVRVNVQKARPLRFSVSMDNYGDDTTGKYQSKFRAELDDPLGLNDFLLLSASKSVGATSFAWHWDVAWGYWSFGCDGSYSEYKYDTPSLKRFKKKGESVSHSWKLGYLIFRENGHKLSGFSKLGLRKPKRKLVNIQLPSHNLTILEFGLEHQWRGNQVFLSDRWSWVRGVNFLGAHKDASGLDNDAVHAQFDKISFSGSAYYSISAAISLSSQLSAQYGFVGLPSAEKLSLMSHQAGARGFSNRSLTFDDGVSLRNELVYNYVHTLNKQRNGWSPFVLLDAGMGKNKGAKEGLCILSGGCGLRFREKRFSAEIVYCRALYASKPQKKSSGDVMFSLSMQF